MKKMLRVSIDPRSISKLERFIGQAKMNLAVSKYKDCASE